ncbi:MAG: tripartite tricarboxylate transporter substrate binding protein [Burkholderiales bacterium]|nr:tripartite tricarboxylate transporter substrate binding protein [Burkholderiales bacterium]
MKKVFGWMAVLAGMAWGGNAHADAAAYPVKPIRLIFPWAPGSVIDALTRSMAEGMAARLGQPVVVESRAGANGMIAAQQLIAAAPDGYTLMMGNEGSFGINTVRPNASYDARRDFTPVAHVATTPLFIVVHPASPYRSLADLIAAARKPDARISYGSIGVGSSSHLAIEKISLASGTPFIHVPYKGSAEVITSIQGGHVTFAYNGGLMNVHEGRVRALAVGSAQRYAGAPNVPTVRETLGGDYDEMAWFGLVAPRGTPAPIVERLNAVIVETLSQPAFKEKFSALGFDPAPGSAAMLAGKIERSVSGTAQIIRKANIQLD